VAGVTRKADLDPRQETARRDEEESVGRPKCGPVDVAPQDVKLVAQHHNLELFEFSRSQQQVN
jgi:hypothetical protein